MKTVAQTVQCHPKIHHMQPIQLEVGSRKQWHTVDGGYWPLQIQLSVYKIPVAELLKLGSDIFEIGSSGCALHTNSRFVCPWWQVKSFSKTLPISSHLCQYSIASKTLGAVPGSPFLLGLKKQRMNLTQSWYQNKLCPKLTSESTPAGQNKNKILKNRTLSSSEGFAIVSTAGHLPHKKLLEAPWQYFKYLIECQSFGYILVGYCSTWKPPWCRSRIFRKAR